MNLREGRMIAVLLLVVAALAWPVAEAEQGQIGCMADLALLDLQLAPDSVTSTVENPTADLASAFVVSDIEWMGQRYAIGVWLDMPPGALWEIEVRFPSTITPYSVYLCDDEDEGSGIIEAPDPVITEIRDKTPGGGNGNGNGNGNGGDELVRLMPEPEAGRALTGRARPPKPPRSPRRDPRRVG
jgi:hypothetical protein